MMEARKTMAIAGLFLVLALVSGCVIPPLRQGSWEADGTLRSAQGEGGPVREEASVRGMEDRPGP